MSLEHDIVVSMNDASQYQYPDPYAVPGQQPEQQVDVQNAPQQAFTPPEQAAPKAKTKWVLVFVAFIIGLLGGGAGGYFVADLFVVGPKLDESEQKVAELEAHVSTLESQTSGTTGTTTSGTSTTGTGTAPVVAGITPDPQTNDWAVYTDPTYSFSFRHPADYEVRAISDDNEDVLLYLGVFRSGQSDPAAFVRVYKTPANDGPSKRDITLFGWPALLPTGITGVPAGAGVAPGVLEEEKILNGTLVSELTATEGKALTQKPDGAVYSGYYIEDQFGASYLIGGCSDAVTQEAQTACLFLTTFEFVR